VIAITGRQHQCVALPLAGGAVRPVAEALLLDVAAGVLFGVSDIALKYLTEALHGGLNGIVSEWRLAAPEVYAAVRGLQVGPGVAVIAYTSVAANFAAIVGGILVSRGPIGIGALAILGGPSPSASSSPATAAMPAPRQVGVTQNACLVDRTHAPPDASTISESRLGMPATEPYNPKLPDDGPPAPQSPS
jgi:hypothetical protein